MCKAVKQLPFCGFVQKLCRKIPLSVVRVVFSVMLWQIQNELLGWLPVLFCNELSAKMYRQESILWKMQKMKRRCCSHSISRQARMMLINCLCCVWVCLFLFLCVNLQYTHLLSSWWGLPASPSPPSTPNKILNVKPPWNTSLLCPFSAHFLWAFPFSCN